MALAWTCCLPLAMLTILCIKVTCFITILIFRFIWSIWEIPAGEMRNSQPLLPTHLPPPMFCLWFFFKGGQNADKKQFQMTVFLQSTKHLCFLLEISRYHTSLAAWDTRARMLTKLSSSPNPSLKFIKEAKVNFLLRSGFCLSRHSCRPPRREPETLEKKINQEETGLQPKLVKMLPARPISDYLCFVSNWHKTS